MCFNPSIPKSDKVLILPHNITLESMLQECYKNRGNDPQLTKLLMDLQILPVRTYSISIENSMENMHRDVRV